MHAFGSTNINTCTLNFRRCKIQFTHHWLQYSTAPNVIALYNESPQK